jgi:iron complex transport system permease protein
VNTLAWPLSRPADVAARSRATFVAVLALSIALAITLTLAVMIGPVPLAPGLIWRVTLDRLLPGVVAPDWDAFQADIIWEMRVPRALLGGLVGAGLALVGATLQTLVRNPLAVFPPPVIVKLPVNCPTKVFADRAYRCCQGP